MSEVLDEAPGPRPPGKLITVGIPVYNGRSLLRNCLQSVINSTLPRERYEIVVADDGSSEPETRAILQEYEQRLAGDPGFFRVLYAATNSGGAARPRNRVLDEATGEYVFFVDSDDTIGALALERIADALDAAPTDWVALNQVTVNGRAAACTIPRPHAEVPRAKALATLTVHKVFRRAEIERQQLRFDEGLPSGQDVSFAFSYLVNASRFLMLGGYDFYYLTQHAGNPNEPAHLSRRARTPESLIEKNERILRSMLTALAGSGLSENERRKIIRNVCLPRILIAEGYLKALVDAGPDTGRPALQRLAELLAAHPAPDLGPDGVVKGLTTEHLAAVTGSDWPRLAQLVRPVSAEPRADGRVPRRLVEQGRRLSRRGRRLLDRASGRVRHRRMLAEFDLLRRAVADLQEGQRRLEAALQVERGGEPAGDGTRVSGRPGPSLDRP